MKRIFLSLLVCFIFSGIGVCGIPKAYSPADSIKIKVTYKQSSPEDQLTLTVNVFESHWKVNSEKRYYSNSNKAGEYVFKIPVNSSVGYFDISVRDTMYSKHSGTYIFRPLSIPFFWEKGDSISCYIDNEPRNFGVNSKYIITGRGSVKYKARAEIFDEELIKKHYDELAKESASGKFNQAFEYKGLNTYIHEQLEILDRYSEHMTEVSVDALKADFLYRYAKFFSNDVKGFFDKNIKSLPAIDREAAIRNYFRTFGDVNDTLFFREGFRKSLQGAVYLYNKLESDLIVRGIRNSPLAMYSHIVGKTENELRELLLSFFFRRTKLPENMHEVVADAEKYFITSNGKDDYKSIQNTLNVYGITNNEYELYDLNNQKYKLKPSLFKDKIVILDFYYIGCPPCRTLYKNTLSKIKKDFGNHPDILFVAISCDRRYDYWLEGVKREEYTTISPNTINLFAGEEAMQHPIFLENNISRFPMVVLMKDGETLHFNTEALYSYDQFSRILKELL